MTDEIQTWGDYRAAVMEHDLTYSYSDDHRCWQRGQEQYDALVKAAAKFPAEDVEAVWREKVDGSLFEQYREPFYRACPSRRSVIGR